MNDDTITTEEKDFEEALALVPEEIQDFMWSDAFNILMDGIQKVVGLTDDQKKDVVNATYNLLVGTKDMPTIAQELATTGMPPELIAKSLYAVDTEILTRAQNITEYFMPDLDEEVVPVETPIVATPKDPFAIITERLTQAKISTPRTETYTDDRVQKGTEKISIDPYREMPEK